MRKRRSPRSGDIGLTMSLSPGSDAVDVIGKTMSLKWTVCEKAGKDKVVDRLTVLRRRLEEPRIGAACAA